MSRAADAPRTRATRGSSEFRIGFLVHDVSRLRQTVFDQAMKPHGVTRAQWWALAQLTRHDPAGGMTQAETTKDRLRLILGEEGLARLDGASIANAHVNDMAGVWAHPQLQARDRWREVDSPVGKLPALLPPGRNVAFEPRMDAVPRLGEHTDSLLGELGYGATDIQRLHQQGAV